MSSTPDFLWSSCLCGVLGLKIIQLFSTEAREPWALWWVVLIIAMVILWVHED